jgi:hypothetical protein
MFPFPNYLADMGKRMPFIDVKKGVVFRALIILVAVNNSWSLGGNNGIWDCRDSDVLEKHSSMFITRICPSDGDKEGALSTCGVQELLACSAIIRGHVEESNEGSTLLKESRREPFARKRSKHFTYLYNLLHIIYLCHLFLFFMSLSLWVSRVCICFSSLLNQACTGPGTTGLAKARLEIRARNQTISP